MEAAEGMPKRLDVNGLGLEVAEVNLMIEEDLKVPPLSVILAFEPIYSIKSNIRQSFSKINIFLTGIHLRAFNGLHDYGCLTRWPSWIGWASSTGLHRR